MSLKDLKNFCPLPFISLFTFNNGAIKICCDSQAIGNLRQNRLQETWNSPLMKEVRRSFLEDRRHPVCNKCWKKEDSGLLSSRQTHEFNESHLRHFDSFGHVHSFPRNLSLRLGNICNFKCIMCQPENSTKWQEDRKIYETHIGEFKTNKVIPAVNIHEIDEWMGEAKEGPNLIYFVGGEPLLSKEFRKSIEYLSKKPYSKSIIIRVFTNLSTDPRWLLSYASFFQRLELSASVDGNGAHYDFIRYPGQWKHFNDNVDKIIEGTNASNILFDFFFVAMSINIFNMKPFCEWVESKDWKKLSPRIYTDILTEPEILSIKYLAADKKALAQEKLYQLIQSSSGSRLLKDEIENMITYLGLPVDSTEQRTNYKKLIDYLKNLESVRGTTPFEDFLTF